MSKEKKRPNMISKVWNLTKAVTKYLLKDKGACGICGCDVELKGQWSTEKCPDNRWKATV